MAMFEDWTTDELKGFRKKLAKAMASGHQRVRFGDRDVTYRSVAEMRQTMSLLDSALSRRAGTRPVRQYRPITSKGF